MAWRWDESGAIFDLLKRAKMGIFYHRLWFWEGEHLPIASFCQKMFLLEAGVERFSARVAGLGYRESCP